MVDADRDDAVLVASACSGDQEAFAGLFRRHAPDLIRFIQRRSGSAAVADDVVAVTFERAWRQACEISDRGISFRPWIFRLAGNELIDHLRSAGRRTAREARVAAEEHRLKDRVRDAGEADGGVEEAEELRAAIGALSTTHQEVIALRWFADMTPPEVAAALGVSTATAAVRTHRALAALRSEIAAENTPGTSATRREEDHE